MRTPRYSIPKCEYTNYSRIIYTFEKTGRMSAGPTNSVKTGADVSNGPDNKSKESSNSMLAENISGSTLRRSIRQALRQKRHKKQDIPRLIIKTIPAPEKSDGNSGSLSGSKLTVSNRTVNIPSTRGRADSTSMGGGCIPGGHRISSTMKELLSGIPGFSLKPRKRSHKKLSTAAQIAQTKEGCIDLETPDSILVNTNLRALINKHTFSMLPVTYQHKLLCLLPECDQISNSESLPRMSATALSNEFFSKACQEWRDRLADGEFTAESQLRLKQEEEKEQSKLDPWKSKHFEPVWGRKSVDIPKAPSSSPGSPVSQPYKIKPSLKKSTLVSTMLKQRSISQTVAGTAAAHSTPHNTRLNRNQRGVVVKVPSSKNGNVENSIKTIKRSAPVSVSSSTNSTDADLPSPPKQAKLASTLDKKDDQIENVSTVSSASTAVTAAMPVLSKVLSTTTTHTSHAVLSPTPSVTNKLFLTSGSPPQSKSPCQTRTLAQIKAQTQAARAQSANRASQGQTRTLAQIKAQTKAHVQQQTESQSKDAQARLQAHILAKSRGVAKAQTGSQPRHHPNIILPSPGRPKQNAKVSGNQTDSGSESDGINIRRSLEICQKVFERSRSSTMVSLLQKTSGSDGESSSPSSLHSQVTSPCSVKSVSTEKPQTVESSAQMTASKLLFPTTTTTAVSVNSNIVSPMDTSPSPSPTEQTTTANSTIPQISTSTSSSGSATQIGTGKKVYIATTASGSNMNLPTVVPVSPTSIRIVRHTGNSISTPVRTVVTAPSQTSQNNSSNGLSFYVAVPQTTQPVTATNSQKSATIVTVPSGATHFLLPSGVPASSRGTSDNILQILKAGNTKFVIKSSVPQRAASAPPIQNQSTSSSQTNPRSASVGMEEQEAQASEGDTHVAVNKPVTRVVQIPSNQLRLLSKTGTNPFHAHQLIPQIKTEKQVENSWPNIISGKLKLPVLPSSVNTTTVSTRNGKSANSHLTRLLNSAPINSVPIVRMVSPSLKTVPQVVSTQTVTKSNVETTDNKNGSVDKNCACSLKAMIMCKKCGAFCHDDCIGPSKLCVTCLITT
ncbi:hypothetical protein ScPMuIL_001164 [Solemya velum]